MDVVETLSHLIAHRTDEGSGGEPALAAYLADLLQNKGADEVRVVPATKTSGRPGANVLARFGAPRLLVNAHLDTVPPNAGWTADPFTARVDADRVIGLGAADTKGAIAAVICALETERPRDTLVLFSGDEETGNACMASFLGTSDALGLTHAIVCEPSGCRAGVRHRGIASLEITVESAGGHSSRADRMVSPLGELARVAVALSDWGRAHRDSGPPGYPGYCVNIAKVDGGVAFNVVPTGATLDAVCRDVEAIAKAASPLASLRWQTRHAPFLTRDFASFSRWIGDATTIDLPYWTEAALLSEAGIDAVVWGPGHVEAAHAAEESVLRSELDASVRFFERVFAASREEG